MEDGIDTKDTIRLYATLKIKHKKYKQDTRAEIEKLVTGLKKKDKAYKKAMDSLVK